MTDSASEPANSSPAPTPASARISGRHARSVRSRRRKYTVAALLLLLSMAAGAAIGIGGTILWFNSKKFSERPGPDEVSAAIVKRMDEVVDLSGDEPDRIKQLITGRMKVVEGIRNRSWEDIQDEFDALGVSIRAIIGTERADRWDAYKEQRMRERNHHPRRRRLRPPPADATDSPRQGE